MRTRTTFQRLRYLLVAAAGAGALGCAEESMTAPGTEPAMMAQPAAAAAAGENRVLATLRAASARYHDLDAAIADDFVLLHPCEERPGEGTVGTVYVHMGRLLDGVIDPQLPDALVYEPRPNGRFRLVAVEFALPYPLWNGATPPEFMGNVFQPEDEFGVWALHAWVWTQNPEGMYAEANPLISCDAD